MGENTYFGGIFEYGFLQVLQLLSRTTIKSTMIDMNHRKFILIFVKLQGGFTTH